MNLIFVTCNTGSMCFLIFSWIRARIPSDRSVLGLKLNPLKLLALRSGTFSTLSFGIMVSFSASVIDWFRLSPI